MEYIYASLLLHHAGKQITEEGIRKILEAAGITVDEVRIKALVAALKEVNIDEAIKSAAIPVATPVAAPAATPAEAPTEAKEEEKEKKEEKEEAAEEEIAAGLAGLFG